jgi:hypothetical protein
LENGDIEVKAYGTLPKHQMILALKPRRMEIRFRFVGVKNLGSFQKAAAFVLSHRPVQDNYPEWPAEIRSAVAGGRLVIGMTKEQASAVIGKPVTISYAIGDAAREAGAPGQVVEIWSPRPDKGKKLGIEFGSAMNAVVPGGLTRQGAATYVGIPAGPTGFPSSVRFVGGKLAAIGEVLK